METPANSHAKTTDGTSIGSQVVGDGPVDLIYASGSCSNVELLWELPTWGGRFLRRLTGFSRGLSVSIGARVVACAGPPEVLVSRTVKDLTADSGLAFEDAGEQVLKSVPDLWRLFRVTS